MGAGRGPRAGPRGGRRLRPANVLPDLPPILPEIAAILAQLPMILAQLLAISFLHILADLPTILPQLRALAFSEPLAQRRAPPFCHLLAKLPAILAQRLGILPDLLPILPDLLASGLAQLLDLTRQRGRLIKVPRLDRRDPLGLERRQLLMGGLAILP